MEKYIRNHQGRRALIEDLLRRDYPLFALTLNWKNNDEIYDLAIIDPELKKPIAVFDSMGYQHPVALTSGPIEELEARMDKLVDLKIPLVIYCADSKSKEGVVYRHYIKNVDTNGLELPSIEKMFSYNELKNFGIVSERTEQISDLQVACWVGVVFISILFIFDTMLNFMQEKHIFLIAAGIFLLIVPFAAKLSILGLSYVNKEKEGGEPGA